jgi:hypothetical protein
MAAVIWTCLVRIKTSDEDRSHLIEKTSFTIGRTEDADLPLTESSVSRSHLSVELRGPNVFVTDLKSGNGTTINGQKIEAGVPIALTTSDVVKLGLAPHEFSIASIPKPFEMLDTDSKNKAMSSSMQDLAIQAERRAKEQIETERATLKIESEKVLQEARKEAETIKTQALIDLQTKKQALESEIASLKQQAAVAASQERLKYAKDADQFMTEAQKKIAQDYENASLHIEQQMQAAAEKGFSIMQEAESKARLTLQDAQDEASRVRLRATDEARTLHQEASKKHASTLAALQEKFQSDMASKREEIVTAAKEDAERERTKIMGDSAKEITHLQEQLASLKVEVGPLQTKKEKVVKELKDLDEVTTQARRELERNSKEVDTVRTMMARIEDIKKEKANAEKTLESLVKRLADSQSSIDKEMADRRQKAILEFENEKKGSTDELAKQRLRALEDVQKRIRDEEKRYAETLRLRAMELAQRISAKIIPALPELTRDAELAGARVKAAIEESTRESLLNESTSFHAPTMDELSPVQSTKAQKSSRNRKVGIAAAIAVVILVSVYGADIYRLAKGTEANSYASRKMEERRIASIYHPEKDPRYGTKFYNSYTDNVLFLKGYYEAKTDSLNQQKWILRLNDLEMLRPMGLTEDDMVAYTSKENAMIKHLGELRDKTDATFVEPGQSPKMMVDSEADDVAEIKKILKSEANFKKIRALEQEFVTQLIH